jgi:dihydroorotate dehydrogenase (NAD+) catalytic subunit
MVLLWTGGVEMVGSDLSVQLGTLKLKNPVLTASGTFGYGLEYDDYFEVSKLGGICCKGLSLLPREGNPPPRIRETAGGMLNAIGLANVGVEAFCADKLPLLRARNATVIANIFATSVEDFAALAGRLNEEQGVAALEVNISCPNVDKGGLVFGTDPQMAAAVTRAVCAATQRPVWIKLSPEAGRIGAVARACEEAGASALCAINTIRGLSIDIETWRPHLANKTGGLSGPALKPIALRMVWEVSQAVSIPVIGIGGVSTAADAIEFLLAGATAVQVGTASFRDPRAAINVLEGIAQYCELRGIRPSDLTGKAML